MRGNGRPKKGSRTPKKPETPDTRTTRRGKRAANDEEAIDRAPQATDNPEVKDKLDSIRDRKKARKDGQTIMSDYLTKDDPNASHLSQTKPGPEDDDTEEMLRPEDGEDEVTITNYDDEHLLDDEDILSNSGLKTKEIASAMDTSFGTTPEDEDTPPPEDGDQADEDEEEAWQQIKAQGPPTALTFLQKNPQLRTKSRFLEFDDMLNEAVEISVPQATKLRRVARKLFSEILGNDVPRKTKLCPLNESWQKRNDLFVSSDSEEEDAQNATVFQTNAEIHVSSNNDNTLTKNSVGEEEEKRKLEEAKKASLLSTQEEAKNQPNRHKAPVTQSPARMPGKQDLVVASNGMLYYNRSQPITSPASTSSRGPTTTFSPQHILSTPNSGVFRTDAPSSTSTPLNQKTPITKASDSSFSSTLSSASRAARGSMILTDGERNMLLQEVRSSQLAESQIRAQLQQLQANHEAKEEVLNKQVRLAKVAAKQAKEALEREKKFIEEERRKMEAWKKDMMDDWKQKQEKSITEQVRAALVQLGHQPRNPDQDSMGGISVSTTHNQINAVANDEPPQYPAAMTPEIQDLIQDYNPQNVLFVFKSEDKKEHLSSKIWGQIKVQLHNKIPGAKGPKKSLLVAYASGRGIIVAESVTARNTIMGLLYDINQEGVVLSAHKTPYKFGAWPLGEASKIPIAVEMEGDWRNPQIKFRDVWSSLVTMNDHLDYDGVTYRGFLPSSSQKFYVRFWVSPKMARAISTRDLRVSYTVGTVLLILEQNDPLTNYGVLEEHVNKFADDLNGKINPPSQAQAPESLTSMGMKPSNYAPSGTAQNPIQVQGGGRNNLQRGQNRGGGGRRGGRSRGGKRGGANMTGNAQPPPSTNVLSAQPPHQNGLQQPNQPPSSGPPHAPLMQQYPSNVNYYPPQPSSQQPNNSNTSYNYNRGHLQHQTPTPLLPKPNFQNVHRPDPTPPTTASHDSRPESWYGPPPWAQRNYSSGYPRLPSWEGPGPSGVNTGREEAECDAASRHSYDVNHYYRNEPKEGEAQYDYSNY